MLRKKPLLLIASPLLAGGVIAGAYFGVTHFFTAPQTPTFTYDQPSDKRETIVQSSPVDTSTATTDQRRTAAPPHTSLSPSGNERTQNAPKQTEVRSTITKEYVYHPLLTANDPGYSSSWALQKVNAAAAWDISTGNNQTVVAVIDSGFALAHQDLQDRWLINARETGMTISTDRCWTGTPADKKTNSCDDDNNGYNDDWRGWNFVLGDSNPMTGRSNSTGAAVSHGTETAGLVGATGNNATGISTINWQTKLMPLQALSDDGPGYTSDIAAAIYYAVDNGADVINLSLGGYEYDPALKIATDYADAHNVIVVAAAGNCGTGTGGVCDSVPAGTVAYPAQHNSVIAVGATTQSDQRASFSSYGSAVDVVAPGAGSIAAPTWTSANQTSLYAGALYGTSYAAPQVSSLISLIKSIRPHSATRDIATLVMASARKLPLMNNVPYSIDYGHGLIDAGSTLMIAQSLNNKAATPVLLQTGGVIAEHVITATDTLSSGCQAAANSFCTIWLRDDNTGRDRYLPYQRTDINGAVGWSWPATTLESNSWHARALQGEYHSTIPYYLNKYTGR